MSAVVITDPIIAKRMAPLLERGRKRYVAWTETLPVKERPMAISGTAIVLRADFIKHAELCFIHVLCNSPTLYILCEANNTLCITVSKKMEMRPWPTK